MAQIVVTSREGRARSVDAVPGWSVMEIIRGAGMDELQALCGGNLSCATCHVIIDQGDLARLPAKSEGESDLLDSLPDCTPESRLSCQIEFRDALDGLRVAIAPEF